MIRVGNNIKLQDKLSRGSYGFIYRCTDENGNMMAAKCMKTGKVGIPEILEANIMATVRHPNINHALSIQAKSGGLYIIQPLALADLANLTRKPVQGVKLTSDQVRKISYDIINGLAFLHSQAIIHGDIKASNILLFEDWVVKITDFSFSVKIWPQSKFIHPVGTATHRSLENLLGREWSYSLDIWALGCTLFEIVYGSSLFPYQGDGPQGIESMIACLFDWFNYVNQNNLDPECLNEIETDSSNPFATNDSRNITFIRFFLPEEWFLDDNKEINRLILSMLRYKPENRPSIGTILNDEWFNIYRAPCSCAIIGPKSRGLNGRIRDQFNLFVKECGVDGVLGEITSILFSKCESIKNLDVRSKFFGCLWIAYKLLNMDPQVHGNECHILFQAERIICNSLKFCLC